MKRRRVKITGLGFVTPAGIGKEEFLRHIQEPIRRVGVMNQFPYDAGAFVGAEVKDFKPSQKMEGLNIKRMPRHTQFAVAAAIDAIEDAGLKLHELKNTGALVMIGATLMDFGSINKGVEMILRHG